MSFELDTEQRELRHEAEPVSIAPKPFAVLVYLIERSDRMVPKAELLDAFWTSNVSEAALQTTMSAVRKVLRDNGTGQVIKTYHGHGFRFVAPLDAEPCAASPEDDKSNPIPLQEQRLVTILAVKLPDEDTDAVDQHARHRSVESFLSEARSRIEAGQGRLMHPVIDGFIAVFGLDSHSDHGARSAASCAWELMRSPQTTGLDAFGAIPVFGIDTGSVILPHAERGAEWTLPGAIERGAAKLADQAAPGDIILSDSTRAHLRDEIETEHTASGHRLCSAPDSRAGIPGRPLRRPSPFVGRSAELAFLHTGQATCLNGTGLALVLSGPAGIGKSRLVEEFLTALDPDTTGHLTVHCLPRLADTPLAPIRQLCLTLFSDPPEDAIADDIDAALLARLLDESAPAVRILESMSEHVIRQRSHALIVRMMSIMCESRPMVIVVEDAHWIDPVSRGYLATLIRNVDHIRLLLVVTTRPADDAPLAEAALQLSPLGQNDSLALLHGIPEIADIGDEDATTLVERAAGNPFFLEELALAAHSGADAATDMPDTVQAVVEARIAALEPDLRTLLYAIAILGPPAPAERVADLLDSAARSIGPDLERMVGTGFLRHEPDGFSCRHMLMHDTAYAMIAPTDRRRLHAKAAELLEAASGEVRPEALALHLQAAGNMVRAISYWTKASNGAMFRSAGASAITFARKGLALIAPSEPGNAKLELGLQLSLATALMSQRGYGANEVGQAYYRSHSLSVETNSSKARLRALLGLWVHTWVAGRLNESLAHGRELLEIAVRSGDPALQLQGHGGLGSVLMHTGQFDSAMEHLRAGIAFIGSGSPDKITTQNTAVTCTSYAAWICAIQGHFDEMQSLYFRSEALSQAIENPFALAIHASLCAGAFMGAGDRATCKVLADMAVEISREHGYPFWLGTGLVLRGWALGQEGAADAGLASIDEGIATFEATNARVQLANWYGIKAETLAAAGRPEDGLAAVRHALDVAEVTGDVWFVPRIHAVAARLQRRIGNREATAHHECEVASLVESNGLAPAFVTVADPRR